MAELEITTRIETPTNRAHTRIGVWQNGGKAGVLIVETAHAGAVIARLTGEAARLAFDRGFNAGADDERSGWMQAPDA